MCLKRLAKESGVCKLWTTFRFNQPRVEKKKVPGYDPLHSAPCPPLHVEFSAALMYVRASLKPRPVE